MRCCLAAALASPACWFRSLSGLAAASLFVYLTHWQVYPHLENHLPARDALSFAVGVVVWKLYSLGSVRLGRAWRRVAERARNRR